MAAFQDTVSRAVEAAHLFNNPDDSNNRRRRRSGNPSRALGYQFERVYDVVGSEAIILCDEKGRKLSGVGDQQLCRLLSYSAPGFHLGDRSQASLRLKGMDLIRPGIDFEHIALKPIAVPRQRKQLFVASVGEGDFNSVGVEHASYGVRRILGIPNPFGAERTQVTSRDRLAYDVRRAIEIGYQEFNASPLAQRLRTPRRFTAPSKGIYIRALKEMMGRVDARLKREGLWVERPRLRDRFVSQDQHVTEGYRNRRFELPVRFINSGLKWGSLCIDMTIYDRQFEIPRVPQAALELS